MTQKAFDGAFEAVKGYIDRSLGDVHARIKAVEGQAGHEAINLSPAAKKVPVSTGDFLTTMELVKSALGDHKGRLDALDGGVATKSAKPRVRVPAGQSGRVQQFGQTYETKDGITYHLVRR